MWISSTPDQSPRKTTRPAPRTVTLMLVALIAPLIAPFIALAEEPQGLTPDISEVFGSVAETTQAGKTDLTPDQDADRNRDAQEDQGAAETAVTGTNTGTNTGTDTGTDTGAKTAGSTSAAPETSTPVSKPVTETEQPEAPAGEPAQSTAAAADVDEAEASRAYDTLPAQRPEGTTGGTMAIPQASSPAGQNHLKDPAAGMLTTPARTGKKGQADHTRDAAGVWDTRTGIVTPGTAGRVVHVFGASIPTLVCQPGMVCLMELEAGEEVLDTPVQADPARWRVELRHRDAPVSQTYFAFKPSEDAAARSNFVVLTDRRVYVVNLVKDLLRSTYILSFDYPDTRARTMAAEIKARSAAKHAASAAAHTHRTKAIARTGVSTTRGAVPARDLDFNYSIRGTAPFKPLRVYNDGRKTYVDLPARYRGDLPVVIGGAAADNKAFNYRVARNGTQFIIDRVLRDFILQDGRRSIRIRRRP